MCAGPPRFLGTPKLHKEGKKRRMQPNLVVNSYPDPSLSKILYPPLVHAAGFVTKEDINIGN